VLGLLLLIGAYLILNVINPDITQCGLPKLTPVSTNVLPGGATVTSTVSTVTSTYNCTPTFYPMGNCNGAGCTPSPSLNAFLYGTCLPAKLKASVGAITGGQHKCDINAQSISCHFGGRGCTDGGHAVDFPRSRLAASGLTVTQAAALLRLATCQGVTTIRCELGSAPVACDLADHIHVNVNNGSCGCN
ncbi:MAG: hypothetical protein Q8P49_01325, partial [Candidatus Liptonbacteria bacterium]|nr:hypothetical protein [Candidatus Liptonbacteria bacterium]